MGSGPHCAQLWLPDEQLRVPASPGVAPGHRPGGLSTPDLLQDSVGPAGTRQGAAADIRPERQVRGPCGLSLLLGGSQLLGQGGGSAGMAAQP